MLVKELIEQLQKLDQDLYIFVDGYEGGYNDARIRDARDVALKVYSEWYYGEHEAWDIAKNMSTGEEDFTVVRGIVL